MTNAGHVLVATEGTLIQADAAFCDIMHGTPQALLGRSVIDLTAPADREECAEAMRGLLETHEPFTITKRMVRADGSLVWTRNSAAITVDGDVPPIVVGLIQPIEGNAAERTPARLLDVAHFLVNIQRDRAQIAETLLLGGQGWEAMLAAYIADAEGRAFDAAALGTALGASEEVTRRWIALLIERDLFEIEYRRPDPVAPKSYRLSLSAHVRVEDHLSRVRSFCEG